jgi:general secretion pathway protein H
MQKRNSAQQNPSRLRSPRLLGRAGFTLIEIMVVIGIIAAVLAIGAPRLLGTANSMRASIRKLAVLTREIRNVARLTNSTGRLVIQMDEEKGHSYWVETASGNALLLTAEQERELERLTELQREEQGPKAAFKPDSRLVRSPISLPRGLFFGSVELGAKDTTLTEGKAYIHFFPAGLSEEAAIYITDRKTLNWTITIHPLTGRAEVLERKVSLKEQR